MSAGNLSARFPFRSPSVGAGGLGVPREVVLEGQVPLYFGGAGLEDVDVAEAVGAAGSREEASAGDAVLPPASYSFSAISASRSSRISISRASMRTSIVGLARRFGPAVWHVGAADVADGEGLAAEDGAEGVGLRLESPL